MRSSLPSLQYARPRLLRRATLSPRGPSSSRYIHRVSPVLASSATASRRVPAVTNRRPPTIRGVTSQLNSADGPKFLAPHDHATCSLLDRKSTRLNSSHLGIS